MPIADAFVDELTVEAATTKRVLNRRAYGRSQFGAGREQSGN
jgi:hypothetical protein